MSSVNKVTLIGNVGKDPETRSFSNGGKVCNFSLATSESWKDKQTGERRDLTQWHNIAIFNDNLIRVVENYVKKGSKLYLEGQLQTRKWQDRDGNDRWTTEVVLQRFRGELVLLDSRNGNQNNNKSYQQPRSEAPGADFDLDDEIPF